MKREPFETWEERFLEICSRQLDEEPLYPYDHLWEKGLSPEDGFKKYLDENPDYSEKFQELSAASLPKGASGNGSAKFLELAKKLEAENRRREAEKKLDRFCPNCAREIGTKKACKCGFRRKTG